MKQELRTQPYFTDFLKNSVHLEDMYKGAHCFLICSGPSLTQSVIKKLDRPGLLKMGINNSPVLIRPNIWTSVDEPSRFHVSIWDDPTILKLVSRSRAQAPLWDNNKKELYPKRSPLDCPNTFFLNKYKGIDLDNWISEPKFSWGQSSLDTYYSESANKSFKGARSCMLQALKIMVVLGIRNIYIVGSDFSMSEEKPYAFEQSKKGKGLTGNNRLYKYLNALFTDLLPQFRKYDVNIFNCTPGSNLTAFEYLNLDKAIGKATSSFVKYIGIEETKDHYSDLNQKLKQDNVVQETHKTTGGFKNNPKKLQKEILGGDSRVALQRAKMLYNTLKDQGEDPTKFFDQHMLNAIHRSPNHDTQKLSKIASNLGIPMTIKKKEKELKYTPPKNFVFAVTTYKRTKYLKECIESWDKTKSKDVSWHLIVSDDGSTNQEQIDYLKKLEERPNTTIIRNNRQGVHHGTNQIIKRLFDLNFDMCFKSDDDMVYAKKGWDMAYYEAYQRTGVHFICYTNTKLEKVKDPIKSKYFVASPKNSFKKMRGCFFTLTPKTILKAGYFDITSFKLSGQGHWDYMVRCARLGLTDHTYYDIIDSDSYFNLKCPTNGNYSKALTKKEFKPNFNKKEYFAREPIIRQSDRDYIPYAEISDRFQ